MLATRSPKLDPRLQHLRSLQFWQFWRLLLPGKWRRLPPEKVLGGELLRVVYRPRRWRRTMVQVLVELEAPPGRATSFPPSVDVNYWPGRGEPDAPGPEGGAVRTAYLPIAHLWKVVRLRGVERVVPSLKVFPRLDRALPPPIRRSIDELSGQARSEVIVGFVDTGIDGTHPAFAGRIIAGWDQTVHGDGVEGAEYGVARGADAGLHLTDEDGHGTHLAGIAAGAAVLPSPRAGLNPAAKLVIVKSGFRDGEVIDGVRYIRDVAETMGLPAVVNLSLGTHSGPHDGSGPLSRAIDEISGPGFIVCAASGNEGERDIHAEMRIPAGEEREIDFTPWQEGLDDPQAHLSGWARIEGSGHLQVAVRSPDGGRPTAYYRPRRARPRSFSRNVKGGRVRFGFYPIEADGDQNFIVDVGPGRWGRFEPGTWSLLVRNRGDGGADLHVWSEEHEAGRMADLSGGAVRPTMKIGAPGDARRAITVGAVRSRPPSTSPDDHVDDGTLQVSAFSSPGPLRGAEFEKPDLVAPGDPIFAPRSAQAVLRPEDATDGDYIGYSGTSQATAVVT
ncbi:MAG: S8 family serine peptidase, partial [Gemmatimonadota bacterium]|nr:S8 family serine peptidase [Gemmatimonadota bacterium]